MAKELIFRLADREFTAVPVKLERKKIYGWTETVATDRSGGVCDSAYLSPYDALIIPGGGLSQGTVDSRGRWVEKSRLTAFNADGTEALPTLPSSFDAPIELSVKATIEEFLDNDWESVYQIASEELATVIGEEIYKFDFSYRGGVNHNDAYIVASHTGLFHYAGEFQEFPMIGLAEETTFDDGVDDTDTDAIDELDFSMF